MPPPASRLSLGLPPRLAQAFVLVCLGFATYFALTFSGPYRWLADLQLAVLGEYQPFLTWLALCAVIIVAAGVVLQVPRRLGLLGNTQPQTQELEEQQQVEAARWSKRMPALQLLAVGVVASFLGARNWIRAQDGRSLERVDVAALERGQQPASTWIEARDGDAQWDATLEFQSGAAKTQYVPVLSPGWQRGQKVAVVLEIEANEAPVDATSRHFEGGIDAERLPGVVNAAFVDAQLDTTEALVLELGRRPADGETTASIIFLIGAAATLGAIVLGALQLRRERAG